MTGIGPETHPANPPKRILSILQPGYMPYIGFFELMARCDVFVLYDDVQYDKNSWRNRNRIRVPEGAAWLTVPVITRNLAGQPILDVAVDNTKKWAVKHLRTLVQYYSGTPFFKVYIPFFESLYSRTWEQLFELDSEIITFIKNELGLTTDIVRSSSLSLKGHKTGRIIKICEELGSDAYISTNGAQNYLQDDLFGQAGIALCYQNYECPRYPQAFEGFVSHLSAVDLLFNCGPGSREVMLSTSRCPFNEPGKYRGVG
ncbi:WbqC family protein [bacterium]|nr:WbqC family protein [bacterium]